MLDSASIPCRLQSEALGPYPLTVGRMAEVEIWVPATLVEEAKELLGADPEPEGEEHAGPGAPLRTLVPVVAAGLLVWWLYFILRSVL